MCLLAKHYEGNRQKIIKFVYTEAAAASVNENADKQDNWRANSETEQLTPPKSHIIFDAHEEKTKV